VIDDQEHRAREVFARLGRLEVELSPEQIEHIAVRAAELGDSELEMACNGAMGIHQNNRFFGIRVVRDTISNNSNMQEWLELGRNIGYWRRS